MRDKTLLKQLQGLPLDAKILMTKQRIREWYQHFNGNVCISFSGGKDSTVLTHLVHSMYSDVPIVFANTGLEYPEIQAFSRKMGAEFVRPKMRFDEVISKYGYPIISKEVAEAIHYARRIVQQEPENVEITEREREREYRSPSGNGTSCIVRETTRRRTNLTGRTAEIAQTVHTQNLQGRTGWRRANLTGNTPCQQWRARTYKAELQGQHQGTYRATKQAIIERESTSESCGPDDGLWGRTDWHQWRRKAIAGVEEGYTGNSQFNKKKWLPLCQETQFKISHYCCNVMKKGPIQQYQRKTHLYPYIGTLAEESRLRAQAWVRHGCNAFDCTKKTSQPLSFWTEQDILHYIVQEGLEIATVYGDILAMDKQGFLYEPLPGVECDLRCTGCQRTGCIFCGFGAHMEKGETRFQRMARTHPRQYEYCMGGGQWVDNPQYDPTAPTTDGDWKNWNPKKIWVPSREGLGMKKVFDDCNEIYGKGFIRYD